MKLAKQKEIAVDVTRAGWWWQAMPPHAPCMYMFHAALE